jgi:hypothetical protein
MPPNSTWPPVRVRDRGRRSSTSRSSKAGSVRGLVADRFLDRAAVSARAIHESGVSSRVLAALTRDDERTCVRETPARDEAQAAPGVDRPPCLDHEPVFNQVRTVTLALTR